MIRLRPATPADLPRIHEIRHGTAENRLSNPALVTEAEVRWYMDEAIFLLSEDEEGVQGFGCANHQSGYIWALFVIDPAQGRGHGAMLLDAMLERLHALGHRQTYLATEGGTKAITFYARRGFRETGASLGGDIVMVRPLGVV